MVSRNNQPSHLLLLPSLLHLIVGGWWWLVVQNYEESLSINDKPLMNYRDDDEKERKMTN